MQIGSWTLERKPRTFEVSAIVDGYRRWYRVPCTYQVSRSGDPFLAAALLPAMLRGESIEIDPTLIVSPKLIENIGILQEIHNCWNPAFKIISILAKMGIEPSINDGTMSFFS